MPEDLIATAPKLSERRCLCAQELLLQTIRCAVLPPKLGFYWLRLKVPGWRCVGEDPPRGHDQHRFLEGCLRVPLECLEWHVDTAIRSGRGAPRSSGPGPVARCAARNWLVLPRTSTATTSTPGCPAPVESGGRGSLVRLTSVPTGSEHIPLTRLEPSKRVSPAVAGGGWGLPSTPLHLVSPIWRAS